MSVAKTWTRLSSGDQIAQHSACIVALMFRHQDGNGFEQKNAPITGQLSKALVFLAVLSGIQFLSQG